MKKEEAAAEHQDMFLIKTELRPNHLSVSCCARVDPISLRLPEPSRVKSDRHAQLAFRCLQTQRPS